MPNKVVFRQIEETSGITLEDYIVTIDSIDGKRHHDLNIEVGTGKVGTE
jgi:hypothetical protein